MTYTPTIFCDASFLNIRACVNSVYQAFPLSRGRPGNEARQGLDECSMGCPFGRYFKLVGFSPVDLRGHPIVCYNSELCTSVLRILRAASTHFPVPRKFLAHVRPFKKITCLSSEIKFLMGREVIFYFYFLSSRTAGFSTSCFDYGCQVFIRDRIPTIQNPGVEVL